MKGSRKGTIYLADAKSYSQKTNEIEESIVSISEICFTEVKADDGEETKETRRCVTPIPPQMLEGVASSKIAEKTSPSLREVHPKALGDIAYFLGSDEF